MSRLIFACFFVFFLACSDGETGVEDTVSVLVSVVPQKYIVEKIAGDLIEVTVLIPSGASPATYEISPADMRTVSAADAWFTIGLQQETSWISDFSSLNENLEIVSTIDELERLPVGRYGLPGDHSGHHHENGTPDPHVWLSPELVKHQAVAVCRSLCLLDSLNSETYNSNLESFTLQIDSLQTCLHLLLDPFEGDGFVVFHPAWGYFADEFNLIQIPIEIAGSEPSPGEMGRLVDYAVEREVKVVFVSPQFSTSAAATIAAEFNARVIFIDPLSGNWADNLIFVAGELAAALE